MTGDSDFVPAIEIVKSLGVIVVLYYSRQLPHPDELLEACDETFEIDGDFIKKIKVS